jgi:hypothetical protein
MAAPYHLCHGYNVYTARCAHPLAPVKFLRPAAQQADGPRWAVIRYVCFTGRRAGCYKWWNRRGLRSALSLGNTRSRAFCLRARTRARIPPGSPVSILADDLRPSWALHTDTPLEVGRLQLWVPVRLPRSKTGRLLQRFAVPAAIPQTLLAEQATSPSLLQPSACRGPKLLQDQGNCASSDEGDQGAEHLPRVHFSSVPVVSVSLKRSHVHFPCPSLSYSPETYLHDALRQSLAHSPSLFITTPLGPSRAPITLCKSHNSRARAYCHSQTHETIASQTLVVAVAYFSNQFSRSLTTHTYLRYPFTSNITTNTIPTTTNTTAKMRFLITLLFTLFAAVFAQDTEVYDSTVYITSTVYRVNTVTMSGASPTGAVVNMTSTIPAHVPTYYPTAQLNGTSVVAPSGTGVKPSSPAFTGAASALNVQAYVAVLAAGVGYLAL